MAFLKPVWTNFVMNHASDADYRKDQDPDESPRHFIDIDNYPVFVQTGRIPETYDSVIQGYGVSFVIDQGILPWATMRTYDSLKSCFQRRDWDRSELFAADLGHYVADGHMPLHITNNYNGQYTGQSGVHSRYETSMISRYETQIVYPADSAHHIDNIGRYIFDYLYFDYKYVDSVLLADSYASNVAGGTGSDAYYQALWTKAGNFTILLMRNASDALADLVYTAWVDAGSPVMYPNAIDEYGSSGQLRLMKVFPNPASTEVFFPVVVPETGGVFSLQIYDNVGNIKDTVLNSLLNGGYHKIPWKLDGYAPGIYFCSLQSGNFSASCKFIVAE